MVLDHASGDDRSRDDRVGDDLLGVVARLQRWATWHADMAVPPAQVRLLALIEELGQARIGDMARADHCRQPTMSAQVQRLEHSGWVDRRADTRDARASLLTLSASGREVLAAARRARVAAVAPLLQSMTPDDRAAVACAVRILDAALVSSAGRSERPSPTSGSPPGPPSFS